MAWCQGGRIFAHARGVRASRKARKRCDGTLHADGSDCASYAKAKKILSFLVLLQLK